MWAPEHRGTWRNCMMALWCRMLQCMMIRGGYVYLRLRHCSRSWQYLGCPFSVHPSGEFDRMSIVSFPLSSYKTSRGMELKAICYWFSPVLSSLSKTWRANRKSRTSSVFCIPMFSSNKCLKYVSLSTASAPASSSAVLVLQATQLASLDIHPIACAMSPMRRNMRIPFPSLRWFCRLLCSWKHSTWPLA